MLAVCRLSAVSLQCKGNTSRVSRKDAKVRKDAKISVFIITSIRSLPLALQHKRRPEIRCFPSRLLQHLDLSSPERGGWRQSIFYHSRVEPRHQLRSRFIVHTPKAHHNPRRARVHESASQTN